MVDGLPPAFNLGIKSDFAILIWTVPERDEYILVKIIGKAYPVSDIRLYNNKGAAVV